MDHAKLENCDLAVLAERRRFHEDVTVRRAADCVCAAAAEGGTSVAELCRKAGISGAMDCVWRKTFGGLTPPEMKRLNQPEEENRKLKRIVADLALDEDMLQDAVKRKP